QFRPEDALILQSGKQIFDGVEHHTFCTNRIDCGTQPYEEALEIVITGFVDLATLNADIIDQELLFFRQLLQIETERAYVLRQLGSRLFERHEDAGLVVLHGAANQELHGQQSFTGSGATANERRPPARKTAERNLIEALNPSWGLGQGRWGHALPLTRVLLADAH